jgi:hypothetical protein
MSKRTYRDASVQACGGGQDILVIIGWHFPYIPYTYMHITVYIVVTAYAWQYAPQYGRCTLLKAYDYKAPCANAISNVVLLKTDTQ